MTASALIGAISIFTAGLTIAIGSICTALAQGKAISQALAAIAQQPDESTDHYPHTVCRARDDRIPGDLLSGHRHDSDFRQSFLEPCDRQGRRITGC